MPTPTSLTSAPTTVSVDGTDLHTYGMVVNEIDNPVPQPKQNEIQIPMKHGAFDATLVYGSKQISMGGQIIADNAADLLTNINACKNFFRLRLGGGKIGLIFHNQATIKWHCVLVSFSVVPNFWYGGTAANFQLVVKTVAPFGEATTASTVSGTQKIATIETISYAGNAPTPLSFEFLGKDAQNLMYGVSEATTGWAGVNCTLSTLAVLPIYGSNNLVATRTGSPANYYSQYDIKSLIAGDLYYVASCYIFGIVGIKLQIYRDATLVAESAATTLNHLTRLQVKFTVTAAQYAAATNIWFRIIDDDASAASFTWDGNSVNEITATEYGDSGYEAEPYVEGASAILTNTPSVSVTGKNLAIPGKKDFDKDNWTAPTALDVVWDDEKGDFVLITINDAASAPWRLDPGVQYTVSWQYRCKGGVDVTAYLDSVGETAAAEGRTTADGAIAQLSLTEDDTWRTGSFTFTMPAGVAYVRLRFSANTTAFDNLRVYQIQAEAGATSTAFEYYRNVSLTLATSIDEADVVQIDGVNKNLLAINQVVGRDNYFSVFSGQFLGLWPGTNNVIFEDKRKSTDPPETAASGKMGYVIKYRERWL